MPSARTMAFSAVLLLSQVSHVSSITMQYFSAAECAAANAKWTSHLGEDECALSTEVANKFVKWTCTSSGATGKFYDDKNCTTACTASGCGDSTFPIGQCISNEGKWIKAVCGVGQAIKIEQKIFSDSACATQTGIQPLYMNAGCTEISEHSGSAWTPKSRMVVVSTSTLKWDEYGTTDCTGAKSNPSEGTCNVCIQGGDGTYRLLSTETCVGGLASVSAGTRSSPLALVAIVVIAYLAW